jgi:zinc transport system substrate-binding protein
MKRETVVMTACVSIFGVSGVPGARPRGLLARLFTVLLAAAGPVKAEPSALVAVPIPPLQWLVDAIGGEAVETTLLVPPGASAEQYDPGPAELEVFQRASLFLAIDIPVERRWLARLMRLNSHMSVRPLPVPAPKIDWNGDLLGGDAPLRVSQNPAMDFHAWNSPRVMVSWIEPVVDALIELQPAQAGQFRQHAQAVRARLDALDERLHTLLDPHAGRVFLTLHPAWGYFAHDYGLEQLAIEAQGHEPGARTLSRLVDEARRLGVRQLFIPPRVNEDRVDQFAKAIGGETLVVDDLAADYPGTLERFAEDLARGFGL